MVFSGEEIALARRMRDEGLCWKPAVGHYVFDETGLIEAPSPFQPRVYFILDMKHFLRRAGDVENLKSSVFWLPQWHQARALARELGISDEVLAERLIAERALESQSELLLLYRLIRGALFRRADAGRH
jgi:hypothetical protein